MKKAGVDEEEEEETVGVGGKGSPMLPETERKGTQGPSRLDAAMEKYSKGTEEAHKKQEEEVVRGAGTGVLVSRPKVVKSCTGRGKVCVVRGVKSLFMLLLIDDVLTDSCRCICTTCLSEVAGTVSSAAWPPCALGTVTR